MSGSRCRGLHPWFGTGLLILLGQLAHGDGRFVEDIQVSRNEDEARVIIQLACPMRYQSAAATAAGTLIELRVLPVEGCRPVGLGGGVASELHRPPTGYLAHLREVEYEDLGLGDGLLLLRFDRAVQYRISQWGSLRSLEVTVTLPGLSSPGSQAAAPVPRTPLSLRPVTQASSRDYVLNLRSSREEVPASVLAEMPKIPGATLYVSDVALNGVVWHRLRLGFFASEEEAGAALAGLSGQFPKAWIGRAELTEMETAETGLIAANDDDGASVPILPVVQAPTGVRSANVSTPGAATLPAERLQTLMAEARDAMLSEQWDSAVQIYTRLLQEPGEHRAEAREYLGLARERKGQRAHARAEYQAFLAEFPEGDGARRVQQRLAGMVMAAQPLRTKLRSSRVNAQGPWSFSSGVSQYYRRNGNQFDEDADTTITQSALMSDADISARRSGERFELLGRLTAGHYYDLLAENEGPGDQSRVSFAYFDIRDVQQDWSVRLGRQSLHSGGILGRFDGAHASYGWADDRELHFTTGSPVDSSRDSLDTRRKFYGFAADFNNVRDAWDFTAFFNQQTFDGVQDRQAIGGEVRFLDERRSLVALVDYDIGYGEVNNALLLGVWRFANRMTLNALVDQRKSPVLTTRNALIGQPLQSLDELLIGFTEDEVRQFALDRTAETSTMTLGFSTPVAERFQINADVTVSQTSGTVESLGVAAIPDLGAQTYYSVTLIGSSLVKTGDVMIVTLRSGEWSDVQTNVMTLDMRLPVRQRRLRLNPRLTVTRRDDPGRGRERVSITPAFRLLWNTRRYRVELETGYGVTTNTLGGLAEDTSAYFVSLGYRAIF